VNRADVLGTAAGVVAPVLFAAVAVGLTFHERAFLDGSGWSPVHRAPVEWPSLLALGPDGWLMSATFVACGVLGLLFARAVARRLPAAVPGAALVAVVSIAVALEAFKADKPMRSGGASWHDRIHGGVYPVIPVAAIAAAAFLARSLWLRASDRRLARLSLGTAVVMSVGGIASLEGGIAQLARYVLFAALLVWLEALALTVARRPA
jgi:hypothetical protein